jgi:hypothetical protein
MTITVKLLRAAGVPADMIARVCELEEQERADVEDERRSRHRAAQAKYRNKLNKGDSGDNHANHVISPKKERSPIPPKEKNYISPSPSISNLSVKQLTLDDSFLTTPRAHARSNGHAKSGNGGGHFEDFWIAYPNKVGKAAARKAFASALTRASIEEIADGLGRYCAKTDDRPWCHPTTWLNQDRWLDEPAEPPPKQERLSARERGRDDVRRAFQNMRDERLRRERG